MGEEEDERAPEPFFIDQKQWPLVRSYVMSTKDDYPGFMIRIIARLEDLAIMPGCRCADIPALDAFIAGACDNYETVFSRARCVYCNSRSTLYGLSKNIATLEDAISTLDQAVAWKDCACGFTFCHTCNTRKLLMIYRRKGFIK